MMDRTEEYLFPHVLDTTRLRHVDELKRAGTKETDAWAAERVRLDTIIASGQFRTPKGGTKPAGRPAAGEAT